MVDSTNKLQGDCNGTTNIHAVYINLLQYNISVVSRRADVS